jgi:hypothetical protein
MFDLKRSRKETGATIDVGFLLLFVWRVIIVKLSLWVR